MVTTPRIPRLSSQVLMAANWHSPHTAAFSNLLNAVQAYNQSREI